MRALLLVFQLFLIARVPWLERALGMDQMTRWHRWAGFWVLWLLLAHVVFITLGYAAADGSPLLSEDTVLAPELRQLAQRTLAQLHMVVGPVDDRLLSAGHLAAIVPDIRRRDVFVCGPPGMTEAVLATLRALDVPADQCHAERFAFAS